jgi:hypothetical protein
MGQARRIPEVGRRGARLWMAGVGWVCEYSGLEVGTSYCPDKEKFEVSQKNT